MGVIVGCFVNVGGLVDGDMVGDFVTIRKGPVGAGLGLGVVGSGEIVGSIGWDNDGTAVGIVGDNDGIDVGCVGDFVGRGNRVNLGVVGEVVGLDVVSS